MRTCSLVALLAIAAVLVIAPAVRADNLTVTFATIPADGMISGPPGSTVGWGYSITNNSSLESYVATGLSADVFQNGSPLAIFDFPVVAPMTTVTEDFTLNTADITLSLGLFEFTWDPGAPVPFTNSGTFDLSGEFCVDPTDPTTCTAAPDAFASYSVTSMSPAGVPEPATLLLAASGLLVGLLRRRA